MSLAPLWFVGLQDFTNPVAVTLERKEKPPFLPLLFSCLFNFHSPSVKGGRTIAPVGDHGFWDRAVAELSHCPTKRGGKGWK